MAKTSFKEIHTGLLSYMNTRKEYPVVSFEDKESVPRQLRGKMFMFGAISGKDKRGKTQLGVMVLENKGVTNEPVCVLTGNDKTRDMRFRVQFQGKLLLLDEEVNVLVAQLSNRLKAFNLTNNLVIGGSSEQKAPQ